MAKKSRKKEKFVLAYITASKKSDALALGRVLVEKKLAACVNVLPLMFSCYSWQGKIEKAREVVLIAKTTRSKKAQLLAEVKLRHRYSVPCVLFLPIESGNPDYLNWLAQNLA